MQAWFVQARVAQADDILRDMGEDVERGDAARVLILSIAVSWLRGNGRRRENEREPPCFPEYRA